MNPAEELARALGGARGRGNSWQACCPAHEDRKPSLSITINSAGKLLVKCHAGCNQNAVVNAIKELGLWPEQETLRKNSQKKAKKACSILMPVPAEAADPDFQKVAGFVPDAIYEYRDEQGNLSGYIIRKNDGEKKTVRPVTCHRKADGSIEWRCEGFPAPRPLFGLEELAKHPDALVLLVEGEKAALAARKHFPSHVVLTWCNGAKGVAAAEWTVLQDKEVVVWPDADDAGKKAAEEITKILRGNGINCNVVRLPENLPKGWDLADPLPEGLHPGTLLHAAESYDSTLAKFAISAAEMVALDLPAREFIVEPFISTSSLAMVAAERGLGKTWFILDLARSVAAGVDFLAYDVPQRRRVLVVDGEMPVVVIQERLKQLGLSDETYINIIAAEMLFHEAEPININVPEDQELLTRTLEQLERQGRRPDLIIFDNISSLGGGIDENDNSALEEQLQFLIRLRHKGYAVLLVHHTGKSGDQRGASRREDLLDTSIKLVRPDNGTGGVDGAEFEVHFTKTRGETPKPPKLTVKLREDGEGILRFFFETKYDARPHHYTLLKVFEGRASKGPWRAFNTQSELVNLLDLSKGAVSKHLTKLRGANLISDRGQPGILLTDRGMETLKRIFGELTGGPPPDKIVKATHKEDPDELGKTF